MGIYNSNCDFNKYKVFYAVAECKSFSKATELLHISQPGISYAIRELEEQLETKLFIRNNKSVVLTEDGEKLLYYVKGAFDNIMMAEDMLKEKEDELTGIIRIGIYSHISLFMLPKVIKEFNKKNPKAKIYVYTTSNQEMIAMLKNKELDFIILQYPIFINENNFTEEIVCELKTCFYSGKEYYDLYMNNDKMITDYPLILPARGYSDINKLEETFKKQNLILKYNITSYASELSKSMVKEGFGISWGLKKFVEKELKDKTLYEIPVNFKVPKTKFSMAYNKNFLNKTTKEFIKQLKEYLSELNEND